MVKRANLTLADVLAEFGLERYPREVEDYVETELKYEGYLVRQAEQIDKMRRMRDVALPADLDYEAISGLRIEARQKLSRQRPANLFQAGCISGVSPADVAVLMVYLRR